MMLLYVFVNNSLFIFMFILKDLPKEKNPRLLCQGNSPQFYMFSQSHGNNSFLQKQEEKWQNKKRVVYVRGGSRTHAISPGLGTPLNSCPWMLSRTHSLVQEPPLQHNWFGCCVVGGTGSLLVLLFRCAHSTCDVNSMTGDGLVMWIHGRNHWLLSGYALEYALVEPVTTIRDPISPTGLGAFLGGGMGPVGRTGPVPCM
jgi:hypothetical protein